MESWITGVSSHLCIVLSILHQSCFENQKLSWKTEPQGLCYGQSPEESSFNQHSWCPRLIQSWVKDRPYFSALFHTPDHKGVYGNPLNVLSCSLFHNSLTALLVEGVNYLQSAGWAHHLFTAASGVERHQGILPFCRLNTLLWNIKTQEIRCGHWEIYSGIDGAGRQKMNHHGPVMWVFGLGCKTEVYSTFDYR